MEFMGDLFLEFWILRIMWNSSEIVGIFFEIWPLHDCSHSIVLELLGDECLAYIRPSSISNFQNSITATKEHSWTINEKIFWKLRVISQKLFANRFLSFIHEFDKVMTWINQKLNSKITHFWIESEEEIV